jgi:hypothetical protein
LKTLVSCCPGNFYFYNLFLPLCARAIASSDPRKPPPTTTI